MLRQIYLAAFMVLCIVSGSSFAQNDMNSIKMYQMQSGMVEYDITGAEVGTEILYFDRWGVREAKYKISNVPIFGLTRTITLSNKNWVYKVDPDKRIGNKDENAILKNLLDLNNQKVIENGSQMKLENIGAQNVGCAEVVGKSCEVWETIDGDEKLCLWHGIPLLKHTKLPQGIAIYTATKVDENSPIDESKFFLPQGIQFIEGDINQILISYNIQ